MIPDIRTPKAAPGRTSALAAFDGTSRATDDRLSIRAFPYEWGRVLEPAAATEYVAAADVAPCPEVPVTADRRPPPVPASCRAVDGLRSSTGRERYLRLVRRAKAYIAAGDVYQVNLCHHLRGAINGAPEALFRDLIADANPLFPALVPLPDGRVIVSASPELFLAWDHATRRIETRPMKGTRPLGTDPAELDRSEKDRAELNMIVDLMRNDLGRIAETGSVRVDATRTIEHHAGGQLQATATVSAVVREGLGVDAVLAATFPPGSVTGAPKVRAMQIIEELEGEPRGVFCGAIALNEPTRGRTTMSVAIRTATLSPTADPERWQIDIPVGAGIVADSDPDEEWLETLLKANAFCRALGVDPGDLR